MYMCRFAVRLHRAIMSRIAIYARLTPLADASSDSFQTIPRHDLRLILTHAIVDLAAFMLLTEFSTQELANHQWPPRFGSTGRIL
jgi:hypothetical protein